MTTPPYQRYTVVRPSKKSRWDFFDETSALPALIGGYAANSHSCADRSVFWCGKATPKKVIKKARCAGKNIVFRQADHRINDIRWCRFFKSYFSRKATSYHCFAFIIP